MRLTNYSNTKIIPGIYYFSIVLFFLIVFLNYQFDQLLFRSTTSYYASLITITILLGYVYFCWKYFEYDGGGEVVVLINKGIILSKFLNYRGTTLEIKRGNITHYKIYNFIIYKRLKVFYTKNKKSYHAHCNITFVSKRKINYLRQSLNKIISKNNS